MSAKVTVLASLLLLTCGCSTESDETASTNSGDEKGHDTRGLGEDGKATATIQSRSAEGKQAKKVEPEFLWVVLSDREKTYVDNGVIYRFSYEVV